MKHNEFRIGGEFSTVIGGIQRWRCTDIGTRTILAIRIDHVNITTHRGGKYNSQDLNQDEAQMRGWFNGPPYAIAEVVFDEEDQPACHAVRGVME
jgi:hypothetical protein